MFYQYAINIEGFSWKDVSDYLKVISEERKKKIDKFFFMKDKIHSLFVELILRYALWEQYGFNDDNIKIYYSKYGKPYLFKHNDIYFNLSHSGNWVLCGIGHLPLGIDVEQIKKKEFLIAKEIYTKEENYFIFNQSSENRIKAFYKIWTLKESYVKNVGKGLSIPFDSFSFRFYGKDIQFYLHGEKNDGFFFYSDQLDDQHLTALCINTKFRHMVNNVQILTLEDLKKWKDV